MKRISLVVFLSTVLNVNAQTESFTVNAGMSFVSQKFMKDEIIKDLVALSNMSWNPNGELYGMGYGHRITTLNCMNLMAHFSLNANLLKKEKISAGINLRTGIGYLFTTSISAYNSNTFEKISTSNSAKIQGLTLGVSSSAFVRHNFQLSDYELYIKLNAGINYLKAHDNFLMPQFGLEVGNEVFGVGIDGNFTSLNYYRELSNGDLEIARKSSCIGSIRPGLKS